MKPPLVETCPKCGRSVVFHYGPVGAVPELREHDGPHQYDRAAICPGCGEHLVRIPEEEAS